MSAGVDATVADRGGAAGATEGLVVGALTAERASFPIVRDISIAAPLGQVTVVLGANGAGKTTLLEAISGVIPIAGGTVALSGVELTAVGRRQRSLAGLAHVEQGRQVFGELTTVENLEVSRRGEWSIDEAFALFPELGERRDVRAGMLSGGEQQMLVIARALATRPRLLMVDEMSLGLAPRVAKRLIASMRTLAERGTGVLLVEQYATLALETGDHAYVVSQGEIVYDGPCQALIDRPEVLHRAYLGERVG
jgi:branched-chain amino acid transport system ATP-binding protein